ncbi:branched-chain amino acid ABC transporter substrate-binding protein [Deferribacterales bacterium RsTz2092]|nr:branched chain amino acid ABC transporter substrate-binding protein [Deferribacterales bacterium]
MNIIKTGVLLLALFVGGIAGIASAAEFIVGVQAPITGPYASEGQGMENAIKLIAKQVNATGGVNGDTIKVIVCDDEGKPQGAVTCAKRLIAGGAKAVIGSYTSGATLASQNAYGKAKVLQTSDATNPELTKTPYKTYFRVSYNDNIEGDFTANYMVNVGKYKRIAIISDGSSFADGLAGATTASLKKLNGNVVYSGKIDPKTQDYRAVLTSIKATKPDIIYYSGYYTEAGLLRKQQLQLDITASFVGGNATDNPEYIKIAGLNNAAGSYLVGLPIPAQLEYPEARQFMKDYQSAYNAPVPSIWVLVNADGLRVIIEAAKKTKSTAPATIANYIRGSLKNFSGYTGLISISEDGERTGSIYRVNMIDAKGNYQPVKNR